MNIAASRWIPRGAKVTRPNLIVLIAIAGLLLLRLAYIDEPAVWIDEAFSLYHAKHSLGFLWGVGWELESSPPLYYTALWAWTWLLGGAEAAARLLSLLLMGIATAYMYRAAAPLGGQRAGVLAALLFACQPLVFEYSMEIRPYSLQLLLLTIAIAAFARLLLDLQMNRLQNAADIASGILPIVAAGSLATYTHATTPVFLAALSSTAAVYGLLERNTRRFWLSWLAANGLVLAAIAPQLHTMLGVIATNQVGIAWIPPPTRPKWVYEVLRSLAVGQHSWGSLQTKLAGGATVAAILWSTWRLRGRREHLAVGLLLPALGLLTLWLASLAQPVLMPRTALWVIAPLCVLVGCALAGLRWEGPRSWLLAVALTGTLTYMSVANMTVRSEDRPWHRFITRQSENAQANDEMIVVDKEVLCVVDYYPTAAAGLPDSSRRWRLDLGTDQSYRSHQRIPLGCNDVAAISVEEIARLLSEGIGVWLLAEGQLQRRDVHAVLKALPTSVKITRHYQLRGESMVWRLALQ